jgi:hypothetical protein
LRSPQGPPSHFVPPLSRFSYRTHQLGLVPVDYLAVICPSQRL